MPKSVSLTPSMLNHGIKNPATFCTHCNVKIPRYPGKYPQTCPNCKAPLKVIPRRAYHRRSTQPVEESTKISIRQLIDEMSSGEATPVSAANRAVGVTSKEAKKSRLFDLAMQYVNMAHMLDFFLKMDIQDDGTNLTLYFSEEASDEQIKQLVDSLHEMSLDTPRGALSGNELTITYAQDPVAKTWSITIQMPLVQPDNNTSGDIGVGVDVSATTPGPTPTPIPNQGV